MLPRRPDAYRTLLDALAAAPHERPFATMWNPRRSPEEETVTFGEFLDLATAHAAVYQARGVKPGHTVVLLMDQSIALLAAFAGALLIGGVPTILSYPTFKVDPGKYRHGLEGVTRNLRARLVVLDAGFPPELAARLEGLETARSDPLLRPERAAEVRWASPQPGDVAFIQHSAGTTGLQKGVALPHRAVLNQLMSLAEALQVSPGDRIVSWLPLYHDMGLIACFILPLVLHVPLVMESPTDWVMWPGSFLRLAAAHRCSLCWLPNFAFQFLARRVPEEQRKDLDLSSLRAVVNCSEPVRAESMEEFHRAYRPLGLARSALQTSYAMAENTFAVTHSTAAGPTAPPTISVDLDVLAAEGRVVPAPLGHPAERPLVSSGRCLPGNRVRVVAEDGSDLPQGAVGQLLVWSPSLFTGYYNRPDLTARALRDGWYWTGDAGFLWEDEVYVLGRKDDVIISRGRNLYPQDLEEIVALHSDIHDGRVVALGFYNPELGTQDVVLVAEVNAEQALARSAEIEAEVRRHLLGEVGVVPRLVYLVPPRWVVKSTAGKPARATTRQKLLGLFPELAHGDAAARSP